MTTVKKIQRETCQ